MKAKRTLLLLAGWCVGLTVAWADPAVLLKEYPARIVRGSYVLGKRIVRVGEVVTVQAVKGVNAEVTTADNDRLTVLLADLRTLPEPDAVQVANPAPRVGPQPSPFPSASPVAAVVAVAPAVGPGIPAPATASARPAATPIQSGSIITSGAELIAERRAIKVRCTHLTKKGTQCSRMTDSPNGFCWQHGGD